MKDFWVQIQLIWHSHSKYISVPFRNLVHSVLHWGMAVRTILIVHICSLFCWNASHIIHIQIPPTGYVGLIWRGTTVAATSWECHDGWGYFEGTLQHLWQEYRPYSSCVPLAAYPQLEYLQWYSNCSSLNGTASYETYVAGQEESGGVSLKLLVCLAWHLSNLHVGDSIVVGVALFGLREAAIQPWSQKAWSKYFVSMCHDM